MDEPMGYRSYLLRRWPRQVAGAARAAAMLESIDSGHRTTLPDPAVLEACLQEDPDRDEPGSAAPEPAANWPGPATTQAIVRQPLPASTARGR